MRFSLRLPRRQARVKASLTGRYLRPVLARPTRWEKVPAGD